MFGWEFVESYYDHKIPQNCFYTEDWFKIAII